MIKLLLSLSLMCLSTLALATPLENLQQELNSFKSIRANFQQALYTETKSPSRKSTGKMAILRPGKFRWETLSPNEQIIIANGSTMWIYDVDLEQATKQQINVKDSNSPALFLSGEIKDIPQRFTVNESQNQNGTVYTLKAKDPDDMFQALIITFKQKKLAKMTAETRLGQRSEFQFSQVELNPNLPVKLFEFKPGKGVDVIQN